MAQAMVRSNFPSKPQHHSRCIMSSLSRGCSRAQNMLSKVVPTTLILPVLHNTHNVHRQKRHSAAKGTSGRRPWQVHVSHREGQPGAK